MTEPTDRPELLAPFKHREAFCLMSYACVCGHQERIWNSRDGVTPFGTVCPSCGQHTLRHENFNADKCKPDHKLHRGQRYWRSISMAEAAMLAVKQGEGYRINTGTQPTPGFVHGLFTEVWRAGEAPYLAIHGYEESK